jgi:hypothetical protein
MYQYYIDTCRHFNNLDRGFKLNQKNTQADIIIQIQ